MGNCEICEKEFKKCTCLEDAFKAIETPIRKPRILKLKIGDRNLNINKMRHVEIALNKMLSKEPSTFLKEFIKIENVEDVKGVAPIVMITVQSDPTSEVGVNGVQALDILKYSMYLFQSLNDAFPCRENALTITKIEEAIHWQDARTKERMLRNVEGKNEA